MINAPIGKEFIFHDGNKASNTSELSSYLKIHGKEIFFNFVNSQKNDFANWIEFVLDDKELSEKLRNSKTLDETLHIIDSALDDSLDVALENKNGQIISDFGKISGAENPMGGLQNIPLSQVRGNNLASENNTSNSNTAEYVSYPSNSEEGPYTSKEHSKKNRNDSEASKNWFRYAQKKISERKEQIVEKKRLREESKNSKQSTAENSQIHEDNGRIIWLLAYFFIVGLIIFLLIYKFLFS